MNKQIIIEDYLLLPLYIWFVALPLTIGSIFVNLLIMGRNRIRK